MKKHALITLLFILYFQLAYCQNKVNAIIDTKYFGSIDILDKPDGKMIFRVQNDSVNEDFLQLNISNQTDSYFYVSISLTTQKDNKTGWIKKAKYIGTHYRNDESPVDLVLYKEKNKLEINKTLIKHWLPKFLTIEKCEENWTYIRLHLNGQDYKGWIENNKLCPNPYTYCN